MTEYVKVGIGDRFQSLSEKIKGKDVPKPRDDAKLPEKKKGIIEWALRMAATRVATAHSVEDLAGELKNIGTSLDSKKSPEEVDGLRAAVMMKVGDLAVGGEVHTAQMAIDDFLKKGDVDGVAKVLEDMQKNDKYKLNAAKKKEVDDLIQAAKDLQKENSTDEKVVEGKIGQVEKVGKKLKDTVDQEIKEVSDQNGAIESKIARQSYEQQTSPTKPARPKKGKVEREQQEIVEVKREVATLVTKGDPESLEDRDYLGKLVEDGSKGFGVKDKNGKVTVKVERLDYDGAKLMYARVNILRGKYRTELAGAGNKELKSYLDELDFELRERLLEVERGKKQEMAVKGLTPAEIEWEMLSEGEKQERMADIDFVNNNLSVAKLLRTAQAGREAKGMPGSRAEGALRELKEDLSKSGDEMAKNILFKGDIDRNGRVVEKTSWDGSKEEFFELCRKEIYRIRSSVPEDRLNQLVFEDTAQTYLALMGISTEDRPELNQIKEAVTKTLYMEFVNKSLWKAGGNHEAWQRAAGLILREGQETNFFLTMKVKEKLRYRLKGEGKEGKESVLHAGFDVDDVLTLGELAAPNGQSWLAYISTDSIVLGDERLKEYGLAMAKMSLKKQLDKGVKHGGIGRDVFDKEMALLNSGKVEFNGSQLEWLRTYTEYMHTATLNVGEKLWLMNSKSDGKGFDYASFPGGQFAEKSGLWGVLYFTKYSVTKYGAAGVGKLFMPNHGLLSYARMETLKHFLEAGGGDSPLIGLDGQVVSAKGGARDFFFKKIPGNYKEDKNLTQTVDAFTKFWETVWLDERTGTHRKVKGMRSLHNARKKGLELIKAGEHKQFVSQMDFSNFEALLGYELPAGTNEQKLQWMVENLDYSMMQMGNMPSKREGDWVNKYSKYYVETVTALQTFLDAPTMANRMKIIESVVRYNNSSAEDVMKMLDEFVDGNRKIEVSPWEEVIDKKTGKKTRKLRKLAEWAGPNTVETDVTNKAIMAGDGDMMEMPTGKESVARGWYLGRGLNFTRQQAKEGTRDPMFMRKLEIQNAIAWGLVDPEKGAEMMNEWLKMIYFGDQIHIGKLKFRPAQTLVLAPYFLFRGWWVDKMGMDWEDFKMITRKQNDEAWAKLKKLLGIEI